MWHIDWKMSKSAALFGALFILLIPYSQCQCMSGCTCVNTSVSCYNVLTFLPHAFPQRTTNLSIHGSFIGPNLAIPFSSLMNLEILDLSNNNLHSVSESVFRFLRRLRYLNLGHNHLVRFDDFVFDHLTSLEVLDLSYNDFFIMPDVPFKNLVNLRIFNISYNKLTELKLGLRFQVMTKIESFDVSGNSFRNISPNALEMTHSWRSTIPKTVNMSDCNISFIHSNTFRYIRGLKKLSLAGNTNLSAANLISIFNSSGFEEVQSLDLSSIKFSNVSDVLESMRDLPVSELILSNNSIGEMPVSLRDYLRTLKILRADNNELTKVSQSITEIASLEELDLSFNKITTIHSSFQSSLTKIRVLNLAYNKLTSSSVKIENCQELEHLDLGHNLISNLTIPSTLTNVKDVNLAGNKITDLLPLSGLTSLEYFDISNNRLRKLKPFLFTYSKNVKVANFSGNQIREANEQTFRRHSPKNIDLSNNKLTRLLNMGWIETQRIDLHGNDIVAIDDQAFYALYSLKYLNLGNNNLSFLQPDAFLYLTNISDLILNHNILHNVVEIYSALQPLLHLERLDLSYNSLQSIQTGTFANARMLSFINLSNNMFVTINSTIFYGLELLKEVDLSFNKFSCNCDLIGLRDWLRETAVKLTNRYSNDSYRCAGPAGRIQEKIWTYDVTKFECDQTLLLIIIFSSVGGISMVVGAIAAIVCHFTANGGNVEATEWRGALWNTNQLGLSP
ncbi:hypothetical protein FSP39_013340 [Pinctada imbricata]|uniref:LRRCT domain-containing protein n=1 Tax=Pinctada imbricata TaxID=66713 RepID=A0AA88Y4F5_PINIB|nr:hypothetical protein FSP39_013340 [Pinctada imbricata]